VNLRYALASDVGSVRENNEDSARALPERSIFVVADGMGGHVAGEVASRVAIEAFLQSIEQEARPRRIKDALTMMHSAALSANEAVYTTAQERGLMGMGTTLTGVLIQGRTACIAHVGDSRFYLVGRKLRVVTQDHTMTHLMVQSGILSEADAASHPERHVLTQAVGTARSIEPDVFQTRIPRGSRLLLCTDGLHDVVPPDEIRAEASSENLEKGAHALIEAAKAYGGPDNITVILVDP